LCCGASGKIRKIAMKRYTLKPVIESVPFDKTTLSEYTELFHTPAAEILGICAIAQRQSRKNGIFTSAGPAIPLRFGSDNASIEALSPSSFPRDSDGMKATADVMWRYNCITLPQNLKHDLRQVSRFDAWLIVFPDLAIMQAEDILAQWPVSIEGREEHILVRAAYATIRTAPALSNHGQLILHSKVTQGLKILAQFRSEAMQKAIDAGYTLGEVSPSDLREIFQRADFKWQATP
jgi:hypothetical protein